MFQNSLRAHFDPKIESQGSFVNLFAGLKQHHIKLRENDICPCSTRAKFSKFCRSQISSSVQC